MANPTERFDCTIAGAGFAGLSCATAVARRGFRVCVLEKKASVCSKIRTTGILVREAVEDLAILDGLRPSLTRAIPAVRLYAPNLKNVRLESPGYHFLATDTRGVLRWLAAQAAEAGAEVRFRSPFEGARRVTAGWDLGARGHCRVLVGADGTRSAVARALELGRNRRLLHGIEYEYRLRNGQADLEENDALHCFIDSQLAPGYIAWALQGVGHLQVGLAQSGTRANGPQVVGLKPAMT
ncbi:MAG: FAD-dependent monooxygenase, partial [Xanthomonadales bacterium]|nr:FAD-dependent monooxygenase [Xanthomonadales bacterium]